MTSARRAPDCDVEDYCALDPACMFFQECVFNEVIDMTDRTNTVPGDMAGGQSHCQQLLESLESVTLQADYPKPITFFQYNNVGSPFPVPVCNSTGVEPD